MILMRKIKRMRYYLLKFLVEIIAALTLTVFKEQWLLKKAGISEIKLRRRK